MVVKRTRKREIPRKRIQKAKPQRVRVQGMKTQIRRKNASRTVRTKTVVPMGAGTFAEVAKVPKYVLRKECVRGPAFHRATEKTAAMMAAGANVVSAKTGAHVNWAPV